MSMVNPIQIFVMTALMFVCACSNESSQIPPPPQTQTQAQARIEQPLASSVEQIETKPVIVVLGDSLSAGFGLTLQQALPAQLSRIFDENRLNVHVVNASASGDTTANGLARYDWSVASAKADIVIVALGANDYLLGLSPEITKANLAAIIEKAQAEKLEVILAGLEPRSNKDGNNRDKAFGRIYSDLAATYDIPLYPALLKNVRDNPKLLQADGLHPTAKGVELMATDFAMFLTPHIQRIAD